MIRMMNHTILPMEPSIVSVGADLVKYQEVESHLHKKLKVPIKA